MREIKLPATHTFSLTLTPEDLAAASATNDEEGPRVVSLGNIVDPESYAAIGIAQRNGGEILYSTTSIQNQMVSIFLHYFMGPFVGHDERRVMFERELLQSSSMSFQSCKNLLAKIVNEQSLLPGKKKSKLQGLLKKIMDWRNAFAHGKLQHDSRQGFFINYHSGEPRKLHLTDDYWDEVENAFAECSGLLNYALAPLLLSAQE